jgi:hypothetical protein
MNGMWAKNEAGGMLIADNATAMYEVSAARMSSQILPMTSALANANGMVMPVVDGEGSVVYDMDAIAWSRAYGWRGYSPRSGYYKTGILQVTVIVPRDAEEPLLFFRAVNGLTPTVSSAAFGTRTCWEGAGSTWTEGRSNSPDMLVTIIGSTSSVVYPDTVSYVFSVMIFGANGYNISTIASNLQFRAFTNVPLNGVTGTYATRDMAQTDGMEVVTSSGKLSFTSRPSSVFYKPKLLYIKDVVSCDPPNSVADKYSMAPSGAYHNVSNIDTSKPVWIHHRASSFGALASDVVVYRNHSGGGGYGETSFNDRYWCASSGTFVGGVCPALVGGKLVSAGLPLSAGRTAGKNHSEDWGALGAIGSITAIVVAVWTGQYYLVSLGSTAVQTVVSSLSFFTGLSAGETRSRLFDSEVAIIIQD